MLMWHAVLEEKGLTIAKFATKSGISSLNLYNWAKGANLPSVKSAIEFCHSFNTTLDTDLTVEDMWLEI